MDYAYQAVFQMTTHTSKAQVKLSSTLKKKKLFIWF